MGGGDAPSHICLLLSASQPPKSIETESQSQLAWVSTRTRAFQTAISCRYLTVYVFGTMLSYMRMAPITREIKSAWELQPKARTATHFARSEAKHNARLAEVRADRASDRVRRPDLHLERTAALRAVEKSARDAVKLLDGGSAIPPGGLSALPAGPTGARANLIASNPASWQRVLHGPETMLREEVTKRILERHGEKSAFRYAACGLGDRMVKDARGTHVAPMGCGHRLCPRCGRTKGRPMIKRIFGWLAAVEHGNIFTMCLTQRVIEGESLPDARKRMTKFEQEYLAWLKDLGMISAASTAHCPWSEYGNGWHYHVHLLIEMPPSFRTARGACMTPRRLRAMYRLLRWSESVQAKKNSASSVCKSGPSDPSLLDGSTDPDFWTERSEGLAKAVQYPVRDIAQGISSKRMGGDRSKVAECVDVLLTKAKGWKLRRTMGQWRKKAPELPGKAKPVVEPVAVDGQVVAGAAPCSPGGKPMVFGTVHRVARFAAKGDESLRVLFRELEASNRNDTDFGKRLLAFCRAACNNRGP